MIRREFRDCIVGDYTVLEYVEKSPVSIPIELPIGDWSTLTYTWVFERVDVAMEDKEVLRLWRRVE